MKVDEKLIDKLADLARLSFNEEEKIQISHDLSRMITFVEKLNELDTKDVEPLIYITDETNVLREDVVKETVSREEALMNVPVRDSDYIKVPKVVRKGGMINDNS